MKNEIFCFKAVFKYNGKFFSSFLSEYFGGVYYNLGKVTKPQEGNGPLAVFDTLKNARRFAHYLAILAGYGVVSKNDHLWSRYTGSKFDLPTGTILVDEFKPIIEVFL